MNRIDILLGTLAVVLAAALISLGVWLLRRAADVLPLDSDRRDAVHRWLPAAQILLGVAIAGAVAVVMLGAEAAAAVAAVAALLFVGAGWFVARDLIAGAVLRAEHAFTPGQSIRVDDVAGRIAQVGARSLAIESADGRTVHVPYARIGSRTIAVADAHDAGTAVRFTLALRTTGPTDADIARLRRATLHSVFASASHEPRIRMLEADAAAHDERAYEITVYAVDPAHAHAIEESVASSLPTRPARQR